MRAAPDGVRARWQAEEKHMAKARHILIGRDAGSGRFISVKAARRRKKTAIVQRVRNVLPRRRK